MAPRRLAPHRRPHHRRRSVVRRARRDDAARGRPVRLPARGVLPDLGVSLRLDAVPRHSDRHHRGGRRRLRPLPGRAVAVDRRRPLPGCAGAPERGLRAVAVDDAACRGADDCGPHLDEHPRPRIRARHSERLHDREDRGAHRAHRAGTPRRTQCRRHRRHLRRFLEPAARRRRRAGPDRVLGVRTASSRSSSPRRGRSSPPTRGTT